MAFEDELGAQPPLGFYDPLGLVEDGDQEKFDRLPGNIDYSGTKFTDIGYGFDVFSDISSAGIAQIVLLIGALELSFMKDATGENEFPGDFRNGFIDYGWDTFDEETKLKKRAIELNQGRAAMAGMLGLMAHDQLGVSILPDN